MVSMGDWCPGGVSSNPYWDTFSKFNSTLSFGRAPWWTNCLTTVLLSKPTNQIRWFNHSKTGGQSVTVGNPYSGQSEQWTIHTGRSVWWTICKWVKQPWIKNTTLNILLYFASPILFWFHIWAKILKFLHSKLFLHRYKKYQNSRIVLHWNFFYK